MELSERSSDEGFVPSDGRLPHWTPGSVDPNLWIARIAYRDGDAGVTLTALQPVQDESRVKKILVALLSHVDWTTPLRNSIIPRSIIEMPLDPDALARGYPVVRIRVGSHRLNMLWDTGATENVLSPRAVDLLGLLQKDVRYTVVRAKDGYIVRFSATATRRIRLGPLSIRNVPWLVTELRTFGGVFADAEKRLDGFLSPQLMLPNGCFAIDTRRKKLQVGFSKAACQELVDRTFWPSPLFLWNGEVYANCTFAESPPLAVQLETGSPATFLRAHAARYLPQDALHESALAKDQDIAHTLLRTVRMVVGNRTKAVQAIDLASSRATNGHDDIATLGTDMLLDGGLVVSFAHKVIGFLGDASESLP